MTQPIHLIGSTYCLPIPDKYAQINIDPVFNELYWWSHEGVETTIPLPTGNWEIICTTKECTEEQAKAVVGSSEWFFPERHIRYIDYGHPYGVDNKQAWNIGFGGPYDSFCSLLACRDLNPETNYVIIKKVS